MSAATVREIGESIDDDPRRLDQIRHRRQLLADLCRKYGSDLAEVIEFRRQAAERLAELEHFEERASALDTARAAAVAHLGSVAAAVGAHRRREAPRLAAAVETRLRQLAMPDASVVIDVGDDDPAGSEVRFLLAANPGSPLLPLARCRVRRRTGAGDARPAAHPHRSRPHRSRHRRRVRRDDDAGVRRGRRRDRWGGGDRRRRRPCRPRTPSPGARRHPPRPGRRRRAPPRSPSTSASRQASPLPRRAGSTASAGSRRSPACCRAHPTADRRANTPSSCCGSGRIRDCGPVPGVRCDPVVDSERSAATRRSSG